MESNGIIVLELGSFSGTQSPFPQWTVPSSQWRSQVRVVKQVCVKDSNRRWSNFKVRGRIGGTFVWLSQGEGVLSLAMYTASFSPIIYHLGIKKSELAVCLLTSHDA